MDGKEKMTMFDIYLQKNTILDHRYQILRVLGRGGFGITYEAVNTKVNRRVAIKEFYSGEYMGREENNVILTDRNKQETFESAKKKFMREFLEMSQKNLVLFRFWIILNRTIRHILLWTMYPAVVLENIFAGKAK